MFVKSRLAVFHFILCAVHVVLAGVWVWVFLEPGSSVLAVTEPVEVTVAEEEEFVEVLAAARDLPAKTTVTFENLEGVRVPRTFETHGMIRADQLDIYVGVSFGRKIRRGELVTHHDVFVPVPQAHVGSAPLKCFDVSQWPERSRSPAKLVLNHGDATLELDVLRAEPQKPEYKEYARRMGRYSGRKKVRHDITFSAELRHESKLDVLLELACDPAWDARVVPSASPAEALAP